MARASVHITRRQEMEVQTFEYLVHPCGVEPSNLLSKVLFAYGEDLRNVHDTLLGQSALTGIKQNVARIVGSAKRSGQGANQHCVELALIATVVLDY